MRAPSLQKRREQSLKEYANLTYRICLLDDFLHFAQAQHLTRIRTLLYRRHIARYGPRGLEDARLQGLRRAYPN